MNADYVRQEYEQGRSPADIATEFHTYPNAVRRLLRKLNVVLRDRSEAQSIALETGRHPHPTKGKCRPDETRRAISEGVAAAWQRLSEAEKDRRRQAAKDQWDRLPEHEKKRCKAETRSAARRTAQSGSKLDTFLLDGLREAGYEADLVNGDIHLPDLDVVVVVHGRCHFLPLWGEDQLRKIISADAALLAALVEAGTAVVLVRDRLAASSLPKYRALLTTLLSMLESILDKNRVHELEVA